MTHLMLAALITQSWVNYSDKSVALSPSWRLPESLWITVEGACNGKGRNVTTLLSLPSHFPQGGPRCPGMSRVSITTPGKCRERPQTAPGCSGSAAGMVGATPGPPMLEPAAGRATGTRTRQGLGSPGWGHPRNALLEPGVTQGQPRNVAPQPTVTPGPAQLPGTKLPDIPGAFQPCGVPLGRAGDEPHLGRWCRQINPAMELYVSGHGIPTEFQPWEMRPRPW